MFEKEVENKVSKTQANLTAYISENFGANASYVEGLLNRFQSDPNLVDESWRTFFGDLLNGGGQVESRESRVESPTPPAQPEPATNSGAQTANQTVKAQTAKPQVSAFVGKDTEVKTITGASKKIVENMETSLTVPTATSVRNMPVKVLIENRTIINENLQAAGRGKVSFTHLIAWAIVKAIKTYPQLNVGYGLVDGKPSRLEHEHTNLGIAIDIEKKDGSRNLLVPNIKGADKLNFAEFFAAYNEVVKKSRDGKLTI